MNSPEQLDFTKGLHILKDDIRQTRDLLNNLDTAITATRGKAPKRESKSEKLDENLFRLQRDLLSQEASLANPRKLTRKEDRLEREAWLLWRSRPVDRAWERLVTFQMPLQNSREDKAWGKVDLVGMSLEGLPVVVELKAGGSRDPILQVMIQALAYGIAIQSSWPKLRPHWLKATSDLRSPLQLPEELVVCPLVCAAPPEYWDAAIKDLNQDLDQHALEDLRELVKAFDSQGFPTSFLKLSRPTQSLVAEVFEL